MARDARGSPPTADAPDRTAGLRRARWPTPPRRWSRASSSRRRRRGARGAPAAARRAHAGLRAARPAHVQGRARVLLPRLRGAHARPSCGRRSRASTSRSSSSRTASARSSPTTSCARPRAASSSVPLLVTVGSPLGVREIQDLSRSRSRSPRRTRVAQRLRLPRRRRARPHDPARVRPGRADHRRDGHEPEREPPRRSREYLAAPAVRDAVAAELARSAAAFEAAPAADDDQLNASTATCSSAAPRAPLRQPRALLRRLGGELRREPLRRTGRCGSYRTRLLRADGTLIAERRRRAARSASSAPAGTRTAGTSTTTTGSTPGPEPVADARRAHARRRNRRRRLRARRAAPRRRALAAVVAVLLPQRQGHARASRGADGLLGAGLHQGDWELVQVGHPAAQARRRRPAARRRGARRARLRAPDRVGGASTRRATAAGSSTSRARRTRAPEGRALARQEARPVPVRPARRRTPMAAASGAIPSCSRSGSARPRWVGWPGLWGVDQAEARDRRRQPARAVAPAPVEATRTGSRTTRSRGREHHVPAQEAALEALAAPAPPPAVDGRRAGADWTISIALRRGDRGGMGGHRSRSRRTAPTAPVLHTYDVSRSGPAPADDA